MIYSSFNDFIIPKTFAKNANNMNGVNIKYQRLFEKASSIEKYVAIPQSIAQNINSKMVLSEFISIKILLVHTKKDSCNMDLRNTGPNIQIHKPEHLSPEHIPLLLLRFL